MVEAVLCKSMYVVYMQQCSTFPSSPEKKGFLYLCSMQGAAPDMYMVSIWSSVVHEGVQYLCVSLQLPQTDQPTGAAGGQRHPQPNPPSSGSDAPPFSFASPCFETISQEHGTLICMLERQKLPAFTNQEAKRHSLGQNIILNLLLFSKLKI